MSMFGELFGPSVPKPKKRKAHASEPKSSKTSNAVSAKYGQKLLPPGPEPNHQVDIFAYYDAIKQMFDGESFYGGFGPELKICGDNGYINYEKLRNRSIQLFTENKYAKGLIQRLLTNVINTGLTLQAQPEGGVLGMDSEVTRAWGDNVESLFKLYGRQKKLIDNSKEMTWSGLQDNAMMTAYVSGDCLVDTVYDKKNRMPKIRLIDGKYIQTPLDKLGSRIVHGVELDADNAHVAYWVYREFGKHERIPAYNRNGQRTAWLLYGGRRRVNQVRGVPLLAAALQALAEIKRFTDSENRAAWINSIIAVAVEREAGSQPSVGAIGRMGVKKETVDVTNQDGTTQRNRFQMQQPGIMVDHLNPGEKLKSFATERPNVNFAAFLRAILSGIAWANELPPEILFMEFQNNFSASRQASNEFNSVLRRIRLDFADGFLQPYYELWLSMAVALGRVDAPGYLDAIRNPNDWDVVSAWQFANWIGVARPSVDVLKEVNAEIKKVEAGLSSRQEAAMRLDGTDWHKVWEQIESEQRTMGIDEETEPAEPDQQDPAAIIGRKALEAV